MDFKLAALRGAMPRAAWPITQTAYLERLGLLESREPLPPALWLGDELLLRVFGSLSATDLVQCQRVCSMWRSVARDSSLWEKLYMCDVAPRREVRYSTGAAEPTQPSALPYRRAPPPSDSSSPTAPPVAAASQPTSWYLRYAAYFARFTRLEVVPVRQGPGVSPLSASPPPAGAPSPPSPFESSCSASTVVTNVVAPTAAMAADPTATTAAAATATSTAIVVPTPTAPSAPVVYLASSRRTSQPPAPSPTSFSLSSHGPIAPPLASSAPPLPLSSSLATRDGLSPPLPLQASPSPPPVCECQLPDQLALDFVLGGQRVNELLEPRLTDPERVLISRRFDLSAIDAHLRAVGGAGCSTDADAEAWALPHCAMASLPPQVLRFPILQACNGGHSCRTLYATVDIGEREVSWVFERGVLVFTFDKHQYMAALCEGRAALQLLATSTARIHHTFVADDDDLLCETYLNNGNVSALIGQPRAAARARRNRRDRDREHHRERRGRARTVDDHVATTPVDPAVVELERLAVLARLFDDHEQAQVSAELSASYPVGALDGRQVCAELCDDEADLLAPSSSSFSSPHGTESSSSPSSSSSSSPTHGTESLSSPTSSPSPPVPLSAHGDPATSTATTTSLVAQQQHWDDCHGADLKRAGDDDDDDDGDDAGDDDANDNDDDGQSDVISSLSGGVVLEPAEVQRTVSSGVLSWDRVTLDDRLMDVFVLSSSSSSSSGSGSRVGPAGRRVSCSSPDVTCASPNGGATQPVARLSAAAPPSSRISSADATSLVSSSPSAAATAAAAMDAGECGDSLSDSDDDAARCWRPREHHRRPSRPDCSSSSSPLWPTGSNPNRPPPERRQRNNNNASVLSRSAEMIHAGRGGDVGAASGGNDARGHRRRGKPVHSRSRSFVEPTDIEDRATRRGRHALLRTHAPDARDFASSTSGGGGAAAPSLVDSGVIAGVGVAPPITPLAVACSGPTAGGHLAPPPPPLAAPPAPRPRKENRKGRPKHAAVGVYL